MTELATRMSVAYTFNEIAAELYTYGIVDKPETPWPGYQGTKKQYFLEKISGAIDLSSFLKEGLPAIHYEMDNIRGAGDLQYLEWLMAKLGYKKQVKVHKIPEWKDEIEEVTWDAPANISQIRMGPKSQVLIGSDKDKDEDYFVTAELKNDGGRHLAMVYVGRKKDNQAPEDKVHFIVDLDRKEVRADHTNMKPEDGVLGYQAQFQGSEVRQVFEKENETAQTAQKTKGHPIGPHPYIDISLGMTISSEGKFEAELIYENMSSVPAILQSASLDDVIVALNKVSIAPGSSRRIRIEIPRTSQLMSSAKSQAQAECIYKDIYGNTHSTVADITRSGCADDAFNLVSIENSRYRAGS